MKICSWIDQFFDTYEKRRTWLKLIVLTYAVLLLGRMMSLFWAMIQAADPTNLLNFQSVLDCYKDLFLIRYIFKILYASSLSFPSALWMMVSCVSKSTWIVLVCCLFLYLSSARKQRVLWMGAGLLLIGAALVGWIFSALSAGSLEDVCFVVSSAGWAGLTLGTIGLFAIGWTFVKMLCNIF